MEKYGYKVSAFSVFGVTFHVADVIVVRGAFILGYLSTRSVRRIPTVATPRHAYASDSLDIDQAPSSSGRPQSSKSTEVSSAVHSSSVCIMIIDIEGERTYLTIRMRFVLLGSRGELVHRRTGDPEVRCGASQLQPRFPGRCILRRSHDCLALVLPGQECHEP